MNAQKSLTFASWEQVRKFRRAIKIQDISREADWRALFAKVAFPHMTQTWAFGEAKRATNWEPRRLLITHEGTPIAICQVLYKRIAGIPIIARINQGPLMLAWHADEELAVLKVIRNRWRFLLRGALLISPATPKTSEAATALKSIGLRRRGTFNWGSSRLDLARAYEDLRKGLDSKWRNQLNKAEKNGVTFETGEVEWIIERQAQQMAEKGFDGASPSLLRALYKAAPEDFMVFKAVHEGKPVAGMVAYRFGDAAHYYVGWFGPEGRKVNAGNFLLWNAALELKRLGVKQFDLGGHNGSRGFSGFKLGMNGEEYQTAGEFLSL